MKHPTSFVRLLGATCILAFGGGRAAGQTPSDVIQARSTHSWDETIGRLEREIAARGLTQFATIDHAANAREAGDSLPPTTVFLFGNPKGGTVLMGCARRIGLDLPLRVLVWEEDGAVWVAYHTMTAVAAGHALQGCEAPLARTEAILESLVRDVTQPD